MEQGARKTMFRQIREIIFSLKYPGKGNSSTYTKYPPSSDFGGKKVLNLGCGSSVYRSPNVVNLDYIQADGVDCVFDLSKQPLPFKDNEFDKIIANMVLEHIPNWWECFKELARVVKVGGIIEIWVPGEGSTQLGYRDHINIINRYSFYGMKGTMRNNANIWEEEEKKNLGHVSKLRLVDRPVRLASYWWIAIMPQSIKLWMSEHLYNVQAEQGFIFRKEPSDRI